jgi:hypothetical protein
MKTFKDLLKENLTEGHERYPADDMTMKELKIACYAAQNILDRLEGGAMLKRWQISAIVKAKEELASVYTSMSADEDEWENDYEEEPMYVGFEYPSMYEKTDLDENLGKSMKKFKKWYGTDPRDVKDRIKNADPEFRDKIKKNQDKLGGAAELQRRLARKMEEAELDEVSKKTLKSYIGKATDELDADWQAARKGKPGMPNRKVSNRFAGVEKAKERMKEEAELDEATEPKVSVGQKVRLMQRYGGTGADKDRGLHTVTKVMKNYFEIDKEDYDTKKPMRIKHNGLASDYKKIKSSRVKNHSYYTGHYVTLENGKRLTEEMDFKVSVDGLPDMYVKGKSPSEIKANLRKIVKKPDMIQSVDRITQAMVKKIFRDKAQGKDDIDESSFVAKAAHAHTAGERKFKLKGGEKEYPVTIKPHHAKKIKKSIEENVELDEGYNDAIHRKYISDAVHEYVAKDDPRHDKIVDHLHKAKNYGNKTMDSLEAHAGISTGLARRTTKAVADHLKANFGSPSKTQTQAQRVDRYLKQKWVK